MRFSILLVLILWVFLPESAWAQSDVLQMIEQATSDNTLAPELKVLLTLSALSLIPAALIAMTAFTRIVIVLSLLRQALGLMQTPPNIVIITLAFFLPGLPCSQYLMRPRRTL